VIYQKHLILFTALYEQLKYIVTIAFSGAKFWFDNAKSFCHIISSQICIQLLMIK